MTSPETVFRSLILLLVVLGSWWCCAGEKLSPNQKAPQFARGSGGLILDTPYDDNKARKTPVSSGNVVQDGVQRDETEMLKLVDGELVRTVKGSFSYNSPEGLPISVKYEADENGNRASFKFGTGETGAISAGSSTRPGQKQNGNRGGQTQQGSKGSKGSSYLPPNDANRSYLPPK
ncbi:uncharacterized protein LOC123987813 [Osmia bicornis bicornis]|uniref:uncharacterized protein LOC123987813 n=1 Tax=Osmia bicornis bicornis TaxID=1437191 RepID=UPI001EAF42FF|nr:uncharacterized protein LOC123987813 [Osmia bicornis bicornis]